MNTLTFHGPFPLASTEVDVLGSCPYREQSGVYLWCVPTDAHNFVVIYIGETGTSFYQRTKEHVINTLGGNYEICDPNALRASISKIVWTGLWRKGTRDKMSEFIRRLPELVTTIQGYLELHRVFVAPIETDTRTRKRIEGELASIIRSTTPCLISPDVRYVNRNVSEITIPFAISAEQSIWGLPKESAA
jgi:hypothetical protein